MTDPDDVRDRIARAVELAQAEGCPVAGGEVRQIAEVAHRRWLSYDRRHRAPPGGVGARVEDLARGLRDRLEDDPQAAGPLMTDYRYLAAKVAEALTTPSTG
ncbi:hypothetical protein [Paraconexibacter sp. AEG42_29]|uniref:hypothetical protein n=1 Tax=Paraconexibacter sp. AEG42_29 TaxID=2997339 RepID=UPI00339D5BD1